MKPYRDEHRSPSEPLRSMLSVIPNLEWIPPDVEIAVQAARLRARHNIPTVDALQAATAMQAQATCLVTNDVAFRKIEGLKVLLLEDYA